MTSNIVRGSWRLLWAFRSLKLRDLRGSFGHFRRFFQDWSRFKTLGGHASFNDIAPQLQDISSKSQSGGGHYFYQDVWALRRLAKLRPTEHHDFGSRLDGFSAQATALCPIYYYDIRQPQFEIPNFTFRQASLMCLPLDDQSVLSASCLHVVEHIGLGRYGDEIDPHGTEKALHELVRVLAPAGQLLLSMPVGRERVEFNAQRIWHPERPVETMRALKLDEFSVISDEDEFFVNVTPGDFINQRYACGLYLFTRT